MLRLLKTLALILMTIVLILFLYPWVLRGLGYYVDNTGGEIGRLAAEKGDVSLCQKIVVYSHFFGPPTMSRRGECVYTYAELTKDPSACELLMPSDYGWDCLGQAQKNGERFCWFDFLKAPYNEKSPVMPECGSGKEEMTNRCCDMANHLYVQQQGSCQAFQDTQPLFDQCQELLAQRERDLDLCAMIQSEHIRISCEVAVRALQKQ